MVAQQVRSLLERKPIVGAGCELRGAGISGRTAGSRAARASARSALRFRACAPICRAPLALASRGLLAFALFLLMLAGSGCVVVHAHERGNLAKRAMTNDRDPGETRFGQHERGSREAADGGTGQPGGGCGCN